MIQSKPSRASGAVFAVAAALSLAASNVWAQTAGVEERGLADRAANAEAVNAEAFDCAAFIQAIAAAANGFAPLRGERRRNDDAIASYGVTAPLLGVCEILDKKKLNEISYSCQADKLSLADLKATVEACLGPEAFGMASNENPNTPYLRYDPQIGASRARVVVLATFGKKTLVIFGPK
ncbi:hypothetical protein [uncultured Rhodoblastus sp.]|uniref:hypothetical protein n=1 Tax=uncultured Rhodoblastus sp. TaxID=543037 RepID=UPI0025EFAAAC|nr:hypothetical protein [uncultured Rhodoblastus sp.]